MTTRLSIVIPFYNVEKYIAECLDSVYNQDIPEEEYEVICVNDASPDGSREIVLDYQKRHTNLVLVEHEVNKKLGAARNTGRRIARGKYLWNVDSDDMIAPNCLGEILNECEKNDLDVLIFWFSTLDNGKIIKRDCPWIKMPPCKGIEFWEQQVLHHQSEISQVWTQVYRKAYLDEKRIYSPEINMSEDEPYTYASILKAERLSALAKSFYINRKNIQSLTHTFNANPNPIQLYEGSYGDGKHLSKILFSIPRHHNAVKSSIKGIIKYVVDISHDSYKRMSPSEKRQFRAICWRHFFQNLYVFNILSRKQLIRYFSLLIRG